MIEQHFDVRDFTAEISLIENREIRRLVITVLQAVPQRFFVEGASTTGKYHCPVSQGVGGLVRHTKLLIKFALEMLNLEQFDELRNLKDELIAAMLLHDSIKMGWDDTNKWTVAEHPNLAADFTMRKALELKNLPASTVNRICAGIRSHSGQWNTDKEGREILPKPVTRFEQFVHLCDYLASRRWLDVKSQDL